MISVVQCRTAPHEVSKAYVGVDGEFRLQVRVLTNGSFEFRVGEGTDWMVAE